MANRSAETEIRTLIESWAKAVREGDMGDVLAGHADDIVMFDVPPPVQSRGIDEYTKTWELFFAHSPGGEGAFDLKEVKITASESVAFCHALIAIFETTCRLTMGFVKSGGQWTIVHEHHSYPIEPAEES